MGQPERIPFVPVVLSCRQFPLLFPNRQRDLLVLVAEVRYHSLTGTHLLMMIVEHDRRQYSLSIAFLFGNLA
jgi:hypothetical protein